MLNLEPGTELAGHRIIRVLGEGGMGVVYEARHTLLERRVALKVLAPHLARDEQFRRRFVRESQAAASLDHPHVIPIYGAGEENEVLYLSMRFVEGHDLKELIERNGVLPTTVVVELLRQAASALDAAHASDLIHRDVKPQNFLVESKPGSRSHLFVSDFGLTKRTRTDSNLTATGTFMGTLDYVSPEQIEGRNVGPTSDQYSLACVLYECLSGRTPFQSDSDLGVIHAHIAQNPPPLGSNVSPALDSVIQKGMAKDPAARFSSCVELLEAVEAACEHRGPPTPPTVPPLRMPDLPRPNWRPAAQPAVSSTPVDEETKRRLWPVWLAGILMVLFGSAAGAWLFLSESEPKSSQTKLSSERPSEQEFAATEEASSPSAVSPPADEPSPEDESPDVIATTTEMNIQTSGCFDNGEYVPRASEEDCKIYYAETFSGGYSFGGLTTPSRPGQKILLSYKPLGALKWEKFGSSESPGSAFYLVHGEMPLKIDSTRRWFGVFDIQATELAELPPDCGVGCTRGIWLIRAKFPAQNGYAPSTAKAKVHFSFGD